MNEKRAALHILLMGQFKLWYADQTVLLDTPSYQTLLAYLVLHPDQTHSRQHLAFLVWPDSAESQARTNLRKALYHLRHTLPQPDRFLQTDRQTVTWCQDAPFILDVTAFEAASNRAQQAREHTVQRRALDEALACYGGDLLPGHYDDWILARREALRQQYLDCLATQIDLLETVREYSAAAQAAQRLLRADPLHETAYRQLMRLQALSGNRAGALRTYHMCTTTLRRELDVAPSAATQDAYRQLLAIETLPPDQMPRRIPLVGRSIGWQLLQHAWQRSTKLQPRFALIRGEAGIGKTRLAEELLDWANRQGIPTLRAACRAPASSMPYAPISTWLRDATVYDSVKELADKWLREVSRVLPELVAERADLKPPGPITEQWQRQHLFAGLAHAILHQRQPFLLFIDDLQWCDPDTLEWLAFLLCFDAQARFLLLATARSEEVLGVEMLISLCADMRHKNRFVEINLGRLNPADTVALAGHVAGESAASALSDSLFATTEGVPLFVVEMARAGFHEPATQSEVLNGPLVSADNLPPRIHSVFAARLGKLSPTARDLADLAATIGRSFTFDLVNDASEMDETSLVRALDELWQQRIVREQGAEAYDFSHGLLRQVAYGSLSAARRRLLHGRVVRALEAQRNAGRAVDDGQLAGHYVAIGRYSAAIASLQHAAMAAQRIFAHNEALANLEQASELSATAHSSEKDLLALHEQRADVLALIGHYAAAHEALDTALAHAADPLDQARLLHKQGKAWMAQHQRPAAMDAYDAALRALAPPPDPPDEQWLQMWLDVQLARGNIFYFDTRLEALAALIEQLDDIANSKGTVDQQRSYLELHNMLAISQKRYLLSAGDVAMRQRISALAEQTGDPHQVAASSFSLGFHYLWSGAVDQGIARLTTALAEATEIGNLYLQDQCLAYLALAYRVQGDTARVAAVVAQHRPISAQVGNPLYGGVLAANEAWLAVMAGDWDSAETHGRAALAMWKPLQYPIQWPALWPLLAVALVQNRLTEAIDYATQLLAPIQQLLDTDIADLLQQAIASCEDGDTAPAHAHLVHAIERVRANHTF